VTDNHATSGDHVELRVPASGAYLAVLRTAAAGLAARLDFTLDDIEDLRIAVDEACALLLPLAGDDARIEDGEAVLPAIDPLVGVVQLHVPTLNILELANVALFLVPVFFAALATRRPLVMFMAGAGLSALVEALQGLIPSLGRACDSYDWVVNTLGAAVGALLALGVLALAKRLVARTTPEEHDAPAAAER
jgi:hypothetical protein